MVVYRANSSYPFVVDEGDAFDTVQRFEVKICRFTDMICPTKSSLNTFVQPNILCA